MWYIRLKGSFPASPWKDFPACFVFTFLLHDCNFSLLTSAGFPFSSDPLFFASWYDYAAWLLRRKRRRRRRRRRRKPGLGSTRSGGLARPAEEGKPSSQASPPFSARKVQRAHHAARQASKFCKGGRDGIAR